MKYLTYELAAAANPEHPVVLHGEFCISQIASEERIERVKAIILSYFNK